MRDKKTTWMKIALAGVILLALYILVPFPRAIEPQFRLTFVQDDGVWVNINDLSETISEDQRSFVDAIRATQQEVQGQADSMRRLSWIDFNRDLCSNHNPFIERQNWLGRISETRVFDDGRLSLKIEVADGQFGTTFYVLDYLEASDPLIRPIVEAGLEQNLRFSGSFLPGDMNGDNECLDKVGITDFPEIHRNSTIRFALSNIQLLPTETFILEGGEFRTADYEVASRVGTRQ